MNSIQCTTKYNTGKKSADKVQKAPSAVKNFSALKPNTKKGGKK